MRTWPALPLSLVVVIGAQTPAWAGGWFERAMAWIESEVAPGFGAATAQFYDAGHCGCAPVPAVRGGIPDHGTGSFAGPSAAPAVREPLAISHETAAGTGGPGAVHRVARSDGGRVLRRRAAGLAH